MKNLYTILPLLIALLLTVSCGLIEFDFDTSKKGKIEKLDLCPPHVADFDIPSEFKESLIQQLNSNLANSFDDIIEEVKEKDTWPADEISLKKLSLVQKDIPASPNSSNTFGFISEMKIYISLKDGSKEMFFAEVKNTDSIATTLKFTVSDKDIINYIDKGFKLRIDSKLRDCPNEDINYTNKMTVHIKL